MFHSLIQKRRSIRKFLEKQVEAEKIDLLVEAALRAPSSRGFNPLEVYRRHRQTAAGYAVTGKTPRIIISERRASGIRCMRGSKHIRCMD